ncbi:hypothetical protein Pmani_004808 [Petrolisthes manimaculis]|uniref:Uncharacterized protein n=1 Tax=Petrolisthes manimaculis TaxID=1843537 RepID=A0AAE1UNL7_9EUCA|nr:hypothetical protein Pmani_004808 [Petrolisthes manimaculis]
MIKGARSGPRTPMENQGGTLNRVVVEVPQAVWPSSPDVAALRSPVLQEAYEPSLFVCWPLCSFILPSIYSNSTSITSYYLQ